MTSIGSWIISSDQECYIKRISIIRHFAMLFDSCVWPKYKCSTDNVPLPCNIAYSLFNGKLFIYTSWNTSNDFTLLLHVYFMSASTILFPLTWLWKVLERTKMGFEILIWYYDRHQEKKSYFWFSNLVISINNELSLITYL